MRTVGDDPRTDGRQVAEAVIVDLRSRADLDAVRGTLRGKMVLPIPLGSARFPVWDRIDAR